MLLRLLLVFSAVVILSSCNSHNSNSGSSSNKKSVGGGCDRCDLMYTGMPATIGAVDTGIDWKEGTGKRLMIVGKILKPDGRTPAPGVILYYYHTDSTGHYTKRPGNSATNTDHGYIRGWVKSDASGHYAILTTRPASYPANTIPAHIHPIIKEPNINEYYIDEFVFNDDPLLTGQKRAAMENRGSIGILFPVIANGMFYANRDIILGKNIPNYPEAR